MTSRIDQTFAALKKQKKTAMVTYIMGFDPDKNTSLELLKAMPEAGVDVIELGMPFSDPMAEGPTIQVAAERALKAGGSTKGILEMAGEFRKTNSTTPLILMGYYNPIFRYGPEKFAKDAKKAGVDGFIIVDLPPEEEAEFTEHLNDLALIKLSAPTTDAARAKRIYEGAKGFAYYVSITGVTGTKTPDFKAVAGRLKVIRSATTLPIAVGFGIKTPEDAAAVAKFADAVVVGSALINCLEQNIGDKKKAVQQVVQLVKSLSAAIKS